MAKYKAHLYVILSIYILIQTSFFPQKLAYLLMSVFSPTVEGQLIITSPYTVVKYYNIVVYSGLAISGAMFLAALRLIIHRFTKGRMILTNTVDLVFRLLTVILVFLCAVTVFHLFRGEKASLFSLSFEALVTLLVLLVCFAWDYFNRHIRPQLRENNA